MATDTKKERTGWTTEAELHFIDDHLAGSRSKLRGYLAGCAQRTNWGAIDPSKVIVHAQQKLAEGERRADFARGWLDREEVSA